VAQTASDAELARDALAGSEAAYRELVTRYASPAVNFIYRFTTDPGASEDLTHEVFLKAFQAASKYEPTAGFSTWLYRIATNASLNHIRDHKPQLSCSIDGTHENEGNHFTFEVRDPRALAEDELIERERVAQIRQALSGRRLDSAAFEVDNTAPDIVVSGVKVERGKTIVSFDVKDDHSPIQKVEFSQDGLRWRGVFPVDGIADSRNEHYELVIEAELGERGVTLRANDTMNNVATTHVDAPHPR